MTALIRSSQFWTLLLGLIFAGIATLSPATQPYLDQLLPTLVLLILAALGAETVAPVAQAYAARITAQAELVKGQAAQARAVNTTGG